MSLISKINAILPQTQCGQCGFTGCKPYAEAIAAGAADINQCPPGGDAGITELARLLGMKTKPLNTAFGVHKPSQVAVIREEDCIGCVKCITACPVDAIIGAAKLMHTVIASECTGCELCLAPCPVDCIVMQPSLSEPNLEQKTRRKLLSMRRYEARAQRKEQESIEKAERLKKQKAALINSQAGNRSF